MTVIEPARSSSFPDPRELWTHRDLFYFLARRDVVIRYKQAIIGALWAILQPVILAAVFSIFLGLIAQLPSEEGVPYPVFAITGMVLWLAFTGAVSTMSESTVASEALITKIYFPRILIPLAAAVPPVVDFFFGFIVVVAVALAYGFVPEIQILAVPLMVLLCMSTAIGFGLWLSALNVRYRDVHLVVPLAILAGLFITPVIYPFDLITAEVTPVLRELYVLNPMVGVLEGFRWAVLGTEWPGLVLVPPVVVSALLIVTGTYYYQRTERTFADVI